MPARNLSRLLVRAAVTLAGSALLTGCMNTVTLKSTLDEPPLATRIDAHVGLAFKGPFVDTHDSRGLLKIDFASFSQTRFEQIVEALFAEVSPLPPWPPWRETPPRLDGIVEIDRMHLRLVLGDDAHNPDQVSVEYRTCLYRPAGEPVNCWESSAGQVHQRGLGERLFDLGPYLTSLTEAAAREALARFMLAFEKDAAVREWAAQVAGGRREQQ